MSVMIKESADRLVVKFNRIAETEGKLDAKEYVTAVQMVKTQGQK